MKLTVGILVAASKGLCGKQKRWLHSMKSWVSYVVKQVIEVEYS